MNLDDKICYCYHVSLRKLIHFARREQPQKASQMSNCLGAGTGCGWCIPILKKIHEQALAGELASPTIDAPMAFDDPASTSSTIPLEGLPASADDYAAARGAYLKSDKKNTF